MQRFMRESDALSWHLERDPILRSTIVFVLTLDRPPQWDVLLRRIDVMTSRVPGFRQRVEEPPWRGAPRWVDDPDMDLGWHVRRIVVQAPLTEDAVLDLARLEATTAFDPARPLWQCTLLQPADGGRSAIVLKVHHCLTDGVGGMEMALLLFDDRRRATADHGEPAPAAAPTPQASPLTVLGDRIRWRATGAARFAARQTLSAVPGLLEGATRPDRLVGSVAGEVASIARTVAPVRRSLSPLMEARSLGRSLAVIEVPLEDLRLAAARAGGSVNDGFLAAVTGGLRRYHAAHDARVGDLRVMMPISIRRPGDPVGGNRITLMRFPLPVREPDPARRIPEIGRRCRFARDEPSLAYTNAIAGALDVLPSAAVGALFKRVDFIASDVRGFDRPVYLAGAEVERYVTFGPTTGTALNATLMSYRGDCTVGVNVDTAAVADTDVLLRCLREGFDEVLALRGPPGNGQAAPGDGRATPDGARRPARPRAATGRSGPAAATTRARGGARGDAQLRG